MGIIKEFKEFAVKGNVIDLAVGIVIGSAFSKIVSSFVNDLIMPATGALVSEIDLSNLAFTLKEASSDIPAIVIRYGNFIQTVVDFSIVAFTIFIAIKGINALKRKEAEAPKHAPQPSTQELLLTEIRDLLREQALDGR